MKEKEKNETMTNENQEGTVSADTWEPFGAGNWLKPIHFETFPATTVCVGVEGKVRDDKNALVIIVEHNGKTYDKELNATNEKTVKAACPKTPKDLIGKKIVWEKVRVSNPSTKQIVDSLNILRIE